MTELERLQAQVQELQAENAALRRLLEQTLALGMDSMRQMSAHLNAALRQ